MRTDRRPSTFSTPSIVVLTTEHPVLHRLASAPAHDGLTADAAIAIRMRIAEGFYDTPALADALAHRLIAASAWPLP